MDNRAMIATNPDRAMAGMVRKPKRSTQMIEHGLAGSHDVPSRVGKRSTRRCQIEIGTPIAASKMPYRRIS